MNIKAVNKDKEKMTFILEKASVPFANALRRACINEVPTMAIATVEFRKNSSSAYDEVIAHRLGLVVLKTDLKSYALPHLCACKGEGCARCRLKLILKAKGPKTVYAEEIESQDPKVVPAYPKTIVCKLLKDQELELEATATLGVGRVHAKWSPGTTFYRFEPIVEITKKVDNPKEVAKSCPRELFVEKKDNVELVKDYKERCILCYACQDASRSVVKVSENQENFYFEVEAWGQLETKTIIKKACEVLADKCDEFEEKVKALS
ncbi:DNA-directed RNA polymerase subunit D [Candidatus Woesearchaeota archaeon]|nr:DNA-directed RNA polymerase subunit D [Candidatus Woesearchaeota archaeon]